MKRRALRWTDAGDDGDGVEERSGPARGVRLWRGVAAESARTNARGIGAVLRASRRAGDRPVADDRAARRLERKTTTADADASRLTSQGTEAASGRESRGTHPRYATSQNRARRRDGRCGARGVARRVFHTRKAPAGTFQSGTEISPKNRSAALTCRRSQKLRIDAARKIETIAKNVVRRAPKT